MVIKSSVTQNSISVQRRVFNKIEVTTTTDTLTKILSYVRIRFIHTNDTTTYSKNKTLIL